MPDKIWSAQIFLISELVLPIKLKKETKSPINQAYKILNTISQGLLNKKNCTPIINNGEVTDVIIQEQKSFQIGDIVTLNPISANNHDFCLCSIFKPENAGFCRVIELEDSDGDFKFQSLSTGKVFVSGREHWVLVQGAENLGSDNYACY